MRTDKLLVDDEIWHQRIGAARARRELFEDTWRAYARLHSDGERAISGGTDYEISTVAGDRVKVSLVFRNLEQTMGYLDLEDFGVSAQASTFIREQTTLDVQHQAVVEQGIYNSMNHSGLMQGADQLDQIKLDALICGHGVSFTSWQMVQEEAVVAALPLLEEKHGILQPKLDKNGQPLFDEVKETTTLYEGVRDDRISPMQFLLDSTASSMGTALWMGFESILRYEELKNDERYTLPAHIEPSSFTLKTLAGDKQPGTEYYQEDSVRVIIVWDRTTRTLIHFLESASVNAGTQKGRKKNQPRTDLHRIYEIRYPVRFDHPSDSPFNWFVPMPCSDVPFGISQVEHIRNPALEADTIRTRRSNIARKQKRFIVYDKNKVNPADVEAALDSDRELEAIGMDVQDNGDPARLFSEVQSAGIPEELLRFAHEPADDVRQNSGIQETPFTGADTATESEIQRMIGQARVNRKRNKMFDFLGGVARTHLAFLRAFAPNGQQMAITLPDGSQHMALYGREAFAGQFHIDVTPGGGASAISPIRQKQYLEAYQIIGNDMGPQAKLMLARQMLNQLDVPNLNAIMQSAQNHLLAAQQMQQQQATQQQGGSPQGLSDPRAVNNGQAIRAAVNPME